MVYLFTSIGHCLKVNQASSVILASLICNRSSMLLFKPAFIFSLLVECCQIFEFLLIRVASGTLHQRRSLWRRVSGMVANH